MPWIGLVRLTLTGTHSYQCGFTLAQLADGVTRGGQLSCARYEQLGGVQGALTRQADAASRSVSPRRSRWARGCCAGRRGGCGRGGRAQFGTGFRDQIC